MTDTKTKTFSFAGLELRSVTIDGKPWFVANDVLAFLYPRFSTNAGVAPWLTSVDASERKAAGSIGKSFGGRSNTVLLTEAALYKPVMRAEKGNPKAAEFQSWSPARCSRRSVRTACTSRARRSWTRTARPTST